MTHATLSNRAGYLGLAVVCLGATGLRLGMAMDDTCLLLDRSLLRFHALVYMVSLQLVAALDAMLRQRLCLRFGRLSVLRASLVL